MKASPLKLIRGHYSTLVDYQTKKQRLRDHLLFEGVPALVVIGCLITGLDMPTAASAGLLTVAGVLSAFLFGVMLQVAERAFDWSDSNPEQGPDTSRHAIFLTQISANAGYAALVSIAVSTVFVVAAFAKNTALEISSAIGLGLATHLMLVLLMVVSRLFALTQERLDNARTGYAAPVTHLPTRKTGTGA
jgi:hypothetical protein